MPSEDSSGEGEYTTDRKGLHRRSSRTPGLGESDSESVSGGQEGGSDELDKAERSEKDQGTKVSLVFNGNILTVTGPVQDSAVQEGAAGRYEG